MPELGGESGGEGTGGLATPGPSASFGVTTTGQGGGSSGGSPTSSTRAPVNTDSFTQIIRLNVLAERVVAKVQGLDTITGTLVGITPALCGTALPAVTLQHKVSTDGVLFSRLSSSTDLTAEGAFSVTVSGWPLYALEITTAAGSAAYARVTLNAKANS